MALKPVTDEAVLSQLNARRPVTDPALLAQLNGEQSSAGPRPPKTIGEHYSDVASIYTKHPFTAGVGMLENALSGITGGFGSVADSVTGSDPGTHDWAYRPRTAAGEAIAGVTADEGAAIGRGYDRAFGTGPAAQTIKERGQQALASVGTVLGVAGAGRGVAGRVNRPLPNAEDVVARTVEGSQQSMGAAAAAPKLTNVSPELRTAISKTAQKTGGAINPEVLARHIEADTLPVRVKLTEGQATQDPVLISQEMNLRGARPELAARFDEQNKQLGENVRALRDEAGPDVFTTNAVEHADTIIAAYKAKDAAAQKVIGEQYKALRDANGGEFPVDARALLDSASAQLHQNLLFDHAPSAVMSTLKRLAENGRMTFENFESMRTNLARIQRSPSADGNEKAAAGVIREAMEQLPLAGGAAALKPLADRARASARAHFQALEADPAYKAAVTDAVPADRFVSRYVINGSRDEVALMRQNLADDATATQTMGVAVLDHLRDAARLNPHYEGNFASASFNKALEGLSPKMRSLLSPKTAEQLERLGTVARYTTFQPRGSYVNNSNTLVAGLANAGASAAEGAVNVAAHGIPIGTWGRRALENVASRRKAEQAIKPGAGLGILGTAAPRAGGLLD